MTRALLEEKTIRETLSTHTAIDAHLQACPHLTDEPVFLWIKRLGWALCPECFHRTMDAQEAKRQDPWAPDTDPEEGRQDA